MSLPEDPKIRPGWWIFSWPWKTRYDDAVEVHDRNTSKGSYAEKIEIPGSRVDENFSEMIDEIDKGRPWYKKGLGTFFKGVVIGFSRWFTEGKYFK